MSLPPSYGDTPVEEDDLAAFIPEVLKVLGEWPTKADVYEIEQAIQTFVASEWMTRVLYSDVGLAELCSDLTLMQLHRELYEDVWSWAGIYRTKEYSIGIDPLLIVSAVRDSLANALYRWEHAGEWTPKRFAAFVHADLVRIHPFVDGNGRTTRLLADLVYLAAQGDGPFHVFDWDINKRRYIDLLRAFDRDRDEGPLSEFLGDLELDV